MNFNFDALAQNDPCERARKRYSDIAKFRTLFTTLLLVLSFFVIATSIALFFFITDEEWLKAAVAGVGIIVEGRGVKFVLDRRTEAKDEEEAAWQDYNDRCDKGQSEATRQEIERMTIFGLR